jgi:hypothetical protein
MTERLHPPHVAARCAPPLLPDPDVVVAPEDPATLLGFPAEFADDDEPDLEDAHPDIVLVALRRPDRVAAGTLALAGAAAGASLLLPWGPGPDAHGLALVRQGVDALDAGTGASTAGEALLPLAVVVAGAVLSVLGLLVLIPARGHRFVGVVALLAALVAVAAVVLLLAAAGWRVERSELGTWFAVAVPGLGLLGALKAMLTPPRITVGHR